MQHEREVFTDFEKQQQLETLLHAEDPFDETIRYDVPRYSDEQVLALPIEEASWMLAPRAVGFARKYRGLGIDDRELVDLAYLLSLDGFEVFPTHVKKNKTSFSSAVARIVNFSLQREISLRHGVSVEEFPVVREYYRLKRQLDNEGTSTDMFEPFRELIKAKKLDDPERRLKMNPKSRPIQTEYLDSMMTIHALVTNQVHPETLRLLQDSLDDEQDLLRSGKLVKPLPELERAISLMKPDWREILDDMIVQGKTEDEVAIKFGTSGAAVGQKKRKALAFLAHDRFGIKKALE